MFIIKYRNKNITYELYERRMDGSKELPSL